MSLDRDRTGWASGARGDCPSGKVAFPTRRAAQAQARRCRALSGDHLRPYTCPDCLAWHVGHLPAVVLRGEVGAAEHYSPPPGDLA